MPLKRPSTKALSGSNFGQEGSVTKQIVATKFVILAVLYTCQTPQEMYLRLDPENQDVHAHISTDDHDHAISTI